MSTIKLDDETKKRLVERKVHPNATYQEVIVTMLDYVEAQEKRKK